MRCSPSFRSSPACARPERPRRTGAQPHLAAGALGDRARRRAGAGASAGNVLRPFTEAKLSLRLPPTLDANGAAAADEGILEADPPYGARVSFHGDEPGSGWNAPKTAPWLEAALEDASRAALGPSRWR